MAVSSPATLALVALLVLALAGVGAAMAVRPPTAKPLPKRKAPSSSRATQVVASPATVPTLVTPPTPASIDRRCAEAAADPVLHSFVEFRSATEACPSASRAPPPQIPYPDVSACPFLQRTNNQPAPASERVVPTRNRPGSTCPRVNVWWSDVCGVRSL
jgi:hypothetical protein